MSKFRFTETGINGLFVVEPTIFGDSRGYFAETYNSQSFADAGYNMTFVQDNQSKSSRGVLRGLHFQKEKPQGKLVRVIEGEIFDVAADLRKASPTYGKWFGLNLDSAAMKQLYIPEGFAHGFLVLSGFAVVAYKCTRLYAPSDEGGIIWNDSTLNINWPIRADMRVQLSEKDTKWGKLKP